MQVVMEQQCRGRLPAGCALGEWPALREQCAE